METDLKGRVGAAAVTAALAAHRGARPSLARPAAASAPAAKGRFTGRWRRAATAHTSSHARSIARAHTHRQTKYTYSNTQTHIPVARTAPAQTLAFVQLHPHTPPNENTQIHNHRPTYSNTHKYIRTNTHNAMLEHTKNDTYIQITPTTCIPPHKNTTPLANYTHMQLTQTHTLTCSPKHTHLHTQIIQSSTHSTKLTHTVDTCTHFYTHTHSYTNRHPYTIPFYSHSWSYTHTKCDHIQTHI